MDVIYKNNQHNNVNCYVDYFLGLIYNLFGEENWKVLILMK